MNDVIQQIVRLFGQLADDELLHVIDLIEEELERRPDEAVEEKADTPRIYIPRLNQLMKWGALQAGDTLYVKGIETESAMLISANTVDYKGQQLAVQTWAKNVTGWKAVNIYMWVILERERRLLWEVRRDAMIANGIEYPG